MRKNHGQQPNGGNPYLWVTIPSKMSKKGDYVVGLDIGTSGVKALAFSLKGKLLQSRNRYFALLSSPEGFQEHDAEELVDSSLDCLSELVSAVGTPPAAIGLCTFMHSMMDVDGAINPLTRLQLWNDNRSAQTAVGIQQMSLASSLYDATGTPIHPMSPLSKIAYLRQTDPARVKRAGRFIGIKEYLIFRMTGELVIDYSTASATGLFDSRNKSWYQPALDICGITEGQLAKPVPPQATFPSRLDGLLWGVPVVPGLSDGCAANLGSANTGNDEFTMTLGTSAAVRFTGDRKTTDPEGVLFCYCLDEALFITGGASNNCYNVVERVASDTGLPLSVLDTPEFREADPGNLLFLPWMFGERAPVQLFSPETGFLSLQPDHSPILQLKAATLALLFNIRHITEKLIQLNGHNFNCMHLSGGLSRFESIKSLASAIFGVPMVEHATSESSALGTAFFAARMTGFVDNYSTILDWNPVVSRRNADPSLSGHYEEAYRRFRGETGRVLENRKGGGTTSA
jgi:gluconokinase